MQTKETVTQEELNQRIRTLADLFLKLHQITPFNGHEERYKWDAVYNSNADSPLDTIKNFAPPKANLFYKYSYATLAELVESRPNDLSEVIHKLLDESVPLESRLAQFKQDMNALKIEGKASPNDERTAAVFLTCLNPQKYTFYMHDTLYLPLCKWLGVDNEKDKAKAYLHYLNLLQPLSELIRDDKQLSSIFSGLSQGYETSNLLNAQTLLWCVHKEIDQITEEKKELLRFKHLLEYFAAHLSYVQSGTTDCDGYEEYIRPLVEKNIFYSSGQGWKNHAIQKQVKRWDKYRNGKMCVNINPSFGSYKTRSTYINWETTGLNIIAGWEGDKVKTLKLTNFSEDEGHSSWTKSDFIYSLEDLGLYDGEEEVNERLTTFFNEFNKRKKMLDMERQNNADKEKYQQYINLLKANKNLILTGAPGTGKTYMAHKIAEAMGATGDCVKMVQFHPSYDYTDFVEGLRPTENEQGQATFERRDGVFKEFCKLALRNLQESEEVDDNMNYDIRDIIDTFVDSLFIENAESEMFTTDSTNTISKKMTLEKTKNEFYVIGHDKTGIIVSIPNNAVVKQLRIKKSDLSKLYPYDNITTVKQVRELLQRKFGYQDDSYLLVLYKRLKEYTAANKPMKKSKVERRDYVFIIDEINRGEISKIFGELFFSIDPGYRGKKGQVCTQYQNLITDDDDEFKGGFFIPENVFIIGTMNDIDRSVESMDFAMRRRFAWKEVKVTDTQDDILKDVPNAELAKKVMDAINAKIVDDKDLGTAYQIGAAYFKNVEHYNGDLQKLWDYHIEGLLREYLRGNTEIENRMKELKETYFNAANEPDTTQG